MMWLWIAVIAYLLLAVAATVDKLMMSGRISHPAVFAFWIALLGLIAFVLAPFGLTFLSPTVFWLAIFSGVCNLFGLVFLFTSVQQNDSTRVVPFVGGLTPLFIAGLAYLFAGERLLPYEWAGFIFLIIATVLIGLNFDGEQGRVRHIHNLILTALFLGVGYFLSKVAFDAAPFLSVFLWSRLGMFVAGLSLLLFKEPRYAIVDSFNTKQERPQGTLPLFMFGQVMGAGGMLSLYYAISIGSVTLVNALQGVQQAFLFLIVIAMHRFSPTVLNEKFNIRQGLQKGIGILLIFIGLGLVAIAPTL